MSGGRRFQGWTAAVTGASFGLGAEFARQLAPLLGTSGRLFLVARRRALLDALAAELRAAHPGLAVEAVEADLSADAAVAALGTQLAGEGADLLVNNAGLGDLGLFENSDPGRDAAMLRVNVAALTALTRAAVPGMVARGRGAVVNVGSVAGYLPLPTFAVYAATKAYVNSFTEALHWELRGTGVTATAVCPGPVPTGFGGVAAREGGGRALGSSPLFQIGARQAVAESLRAALRGRPRIVPGGWMRLAVLGMRALPLEALRLAFRATVPAQARAQRKAP